MHKVILLGAGGHCKVVISHLRLTDIEILGILDDNERIMGKSLMGVRVLDTIDRVSNYREKMDHAVIAVTDPMTRKKLDARCAEAGIQTIGFIHPKAVIAREARVSGKAQICVCSIVNPDVVVGDNAIINSGALIEHDCEIGAYCHIAPGAKLMGNVKVGPMTMVGASATILQNIHIGGSSIIGAGSLVNRSVEDHSKYLGVPAKRMEVLK